jgi:hypothetical protein
MKLSETTSKFISLIKLSESSEWVRDVDAELDRFTKQDGEKLYVVASEAGGHDISVVASVYATKSDFENGDNPEESSVVSTSSSEGPAYDFINEMNDLLQDDQPQVVWDRILRDSESVSREDEG